MSDPGERDKLIEIARAIDQGNSPEIGCHEEIERVQNALGFLDGVRADLDQTGSEHTTDVAGETVPGYSIGESSTTRRMPMEIGRFKILDQIGQGGSAKVFLAYDPQLNRNTALKVLLSNHMFSEEAAVRFEREARATAMLSHPNIIPIFETGKIEDDLFIISEYCSGKSLDQWFKKNKPVDIRQTAQIVATIAEAAGHAHQRGIIHRDLKPANVLVEQLRDDEDSMASRIKVTDFGLAKQLQSSDTLQTREGIIVGTPAYMSPEQADGMGKVTTASDIYSIGVILYEFLTGQLPVEKANNIDTLIAVKRNAITPPRKLNRQIPKDLQAVCLKCLHGNPEQRYDSAFQLATDLNKWLRGESVTARNITALERSSLWCRRNPGITAALIAMTLGLAFAFVQWNRAVIAADVAGKSNKLAQQTVREMVNDISRSSNIPPELSRDLVERGIILQEQLLLADPDNKTIRSESARAYLCLATLEFALMRLDESIVACDAGIDIINYCPEDKWTPDLRGFHGHLVLAKARALTNLGKTQESLELIAGVEFDPKNIVAESSKFLETARAKIDTGEYQDAWDTAERGLIMLQARPEHLDAYAELIAKSHISFLLFYRGSAENQLERWRDAEATLQESIQTLEAIMPIMGYHESVSGVLAEAFGMLGTAQMGQGNYESAIKNIQTSVKGYTHLSESNSKVIRFAKKKLEFNLDLVECYLNTDAVESAKALIAEMEKETDALSLDDEQLEYFSDELSNLKELSESIE